MRGGRGGEIWRYLEYTVYRYLIAIAVWNINEHVTSYIYAEKALNKVHVCRKTESYHAANSIATGGIGGCRYDNPRCPRRRQGQNHKCQLTLCWPNNLHTCVFAISLKTDTPVYWLNTNMCSVYFVYLDSSVLAPLYGIQPIFTTKQI